jgi:hypothetical protein
VQQILYAANTGDAADRVLDPMHLPFVVERAAEHDNPAISVDADLSLGNRPVAEKLALHLAHETDVIDRAGVVGAVRDRVREPDELARLVVRVTLDPPSTATNRAHRAVANEVSPALAAARIKEELERNTRAKRKRGDRNQSPARARALPDGLAATPSEQPSRQPVSSPQLDTFMHSGHATLPSAGLNADTRHASAGDVNLKGSDLQAAERRSEISLRAYALTRQLRG